MFPSDQGWAKTKATIQECNPDLAHWWQEARNLSHHGCLPGSALPGSWRQELEPGIQASDSPVGHRHLNHWAGYPPPRDSRAMSLSHTQAPATSGVVNCLCFSAPVIEPGPYLCLQSNCLTISILDSALLDESPFSRKVNLKQKHMQPWFHVECNARETGVMEKTARQRIIDTKGHGITHKGMRLCMEVSSQGPHETIVWETPVLGRKEKEHNCFSLSSLILEGLTDYPALPGLSHKSAVHEAVHPWVAPGKSQELVREGCTRDVAACPLGQHQRPCLVGAEQPGSEAGESAFPSLLCWES